MTMKMMMMMMMMMMIAWNSGTGTNLLSTNWFIEHLGWLQQVLLSGVFLANEVLF